GGGRAPPPRRGERGRVAAGRQTRPAALDTSRESLQPRDRAGDRVGAVPVDREEDEELPGREGERNTFCSDGFRLVWCESGQLEAWERMYFFEGGEGMERRGGISRSRFWRRCGLAVAPLTF